MLDWWHRKQAQLQLLRVLYSADDVLAVGAGTQTVLTALLLLILGYCRQIWHANGCTMDAPAF